MCTAIPRVKPTSSGLEGGQILAARQALPSLEPFLKQTKLSFRSPTPLKWIKLSLNKPFLKKIKSSL